MQKLLTLHRYRMLRLCPWKYIASLSWDSADGWGFNNMTGGGHSLDSGKPGALKQQTIGLLHAIAYLRGRAPNKACSLLLSSYFCVPSHALVQRSSAIVCKKDCRKAALERKVGNAVRSIPYVRDVSVQCLLLSPMLWSSW